MYFARRLSLVRRLAARRPCSTGAPNKATPAAASVLADGPTLSDFLQSSSSQEIGESNVTPLHSGSSLNSNNEKYYIETYGCQMNVSDTEIIRAIFDGAGYTPTSDMQDADIIFVNTCAIRENAEAKVWQRLSNFRKLKLSKPKNERPVVGVLGCMAERLKKKLLESDRLVDVVAGPDAYRDLPRLVQVVRGGEEGSAINVQLSQDETYADILPVREASRVHAFVSIMRGCNNMCSFCIVPFTRGRERSRHVQSIVDEARKLEESGYKELVLLGQNVNSYHDLSTPSDWPDAAEYRAAEGFNNMYKLRNGDGVRFGELLEKVAAAVPEMRIRFTSPHPKDFPDEVLHLVRETPNICNQIHLPAQSGNTDMLFRMRRNYTREAYIALADRIREMIPNVAISSDFIAGFCGETEEEHQDTLSLLRHVGYEHAFMFAYSMRERTHASYKLQDDVPEDVKLRRLQEIVTTFRDIAYERNQNEIGKRHVVLVEGPSKRSTPDNPTFVGRTDNNKRCHVPDVPIPATLTDALGPTQAPTVQLQPGDYVVVDVLSAGVNQLNVVPVARTSIKEAAALLGDCLWSPAYQE